MQMIYGDLRRAGLIRTGDILEILDPVTSRPLIVTVATADRITSINPNFPDSIHFQFDNSETGRIAWGSCVTDYLQAVEEVRPVFNGFLQKKPQPFIEEKPEKSKLIARRKFTQIKEVKRGGLRAKLKR